MVVILCNDINKFPMHEFIELMQSFIVKIFHFHKNRVYNVYEKSFHVSIRHAKRLINGFHVSFTHLSHKVSLVNVLEITKSIVCKNFYCQLHIYTKPQLKT